MQRWLPQRNGSGHSGCHLNNINDHEVPMSLIKSMFPILWGWCSCIEEVGALAGCRPTKLQVDNLTPWLYKIWHPCLVLVSTRIEFAAFFQVAKAISCVNKNWMALFTACLPKQVFLFFCRFCRPPPLFCQRYLLKCESILEATQMSIKYYPCWLNQCIHFNQSFLVPC